MPFKPLVTAGIESLLNTFLYRSPALKTARSRLLGKVLRVEVKGFSTSLILVFSERQVDVLGEWAGDADCTVIAYASVLPKLLIPVISPLKVSAKPCAEAQSSCITALSASNVMWRKPLLKSGVWHLVRLKWPGLRKRRLPSSVLLMP